MPKKLGQASANFSSNRQSDEVNSMLSDFMDQLGIQAGSIRDLSSDEERIEMIPTGVQSLDVALKGGIPVRTIVELFGESGGGKSWLAQKIAASVTYEGGKCFFMDAELAFNPFRAQDIGLDINLVTYWDGFDTGEQVMSMFDKLFNDRDWKRPYPQPKPYRVIVLDSVAVLPTRNDIEADLVSDKANAPKIRPGAKALMMSQSLRKMAPSFSRSAGVWREEREVARYHNESFPLDKAAVPDDIRKELIKLAKKRAPYGYDLFEDEAQREIGEIPQDVVEFERMLTGQVIEVRDSGLVTMHHNPGPLLIVVNQTRLTGFGTYAGAQKTTTGGQALLFSAGTRINIEPVTGSRKTRMKGPDGKMADVYLPKGEVRDPVTGEVTHYLSKGKIIKSRYTTKAIDIVVKIPVGETKDDVFDDMISLLKERKLYDYSRGSHKVYLEPGDDPVIKTKDNEEFLDLMLATGIDLVASKLGLTDDQVEAIKQHCEDKLSQYNIVDDDDSSLDDDDEDEEDEQ